MMKGFLALSLLFALNVSAQEIKSVNFLQEGEISKLVIEVDKETYAERFHVTDDKQIILDLKNVKANAKVLRGIDTSEFDGSIVYVSGYQKPGAKGDIRFALQLRDNVRSTLETSKNKIILNVESRFGVFSKAKVKASEEGVTSKGGSSNEVVEDNLRLNVPKSASIEDILENLTLAGPKKYIGKRISVNVQDIQVPDLLKMIADTSGFNIIIDKQVSTSPPLTLTLTNIPWDQALDTILNLSKLVASKNANILSVKTLGQATAEKEAEAKAEALKMGLEPLVTKVFPISFAEIPSLTRIITDYLTPNRGKIQSDDRTNSLIVKDTVDTIEKVKRIIELLDTQTPQILIESKIVEASESYSKRLGLSRGLSFGYDPVRAGTAAAVGPGFSFNSAPTGESPDTLGMSIAIYKRLLNLDFTLQMMESESKGRVISSPKVITQNKKAATITSTDQTSFRVTQLAQGGQGGNAIPQVTFQTVSATLSLAVTPQVSNEGSISMKVDVSKSSFGTRPSADAPPNQTTRQISTNVLVDNGSTVVLGGLYSTSSSESRSGVPFLKDLPLVGWLFKTPYAPQTDKSELIIFLTPRIINQEEAGLVERQSVATDT